MCLVRGYYEGEVVNIGGLLTPIKLLRFRQVMKKEKEKSSMVQENSESGTHAK